MQRHPAPGSCRFATDRWSAGADRPARLAGSSAAPWRRAVSPLASRQPPLRLAAGRGIGSDRAAHARRPRHREEAMAEIRTTHLFTMTLDVGGMQPIGATPSGNRRIGLVAGGTFEGARLRGKVLPGGADWIIVRPDGVDHAGCAPGAGDRRRRGDRHDLSRPAPRPGRGDGPAQSRRDRRSGARIISAPPSRSKPRRRNTTG